MHVTHRHVLAFLWRYMRGHRLMLSGMTVLLLLKVGLQLLEPFFYREAVDAIAEASPGDVHILRSAMLAILGGVGVALLSNTCNELANRMLAWVETRVMVCVHADAFAHVQRLSTQFHVSTFAGATARKIGRGTDAVESMMDHLWFNFLPLVVATVGFTIVLFRFAPPIGIAVVAWLLIYIPFSIAINLYHARFFAWTDRQDTRVTASLVDAITHNMLVKAFGAEGKEEGRHGAVLTEWQWRMWKTWRMGNVIGWLHSALLIGIEGCLLLIAVWLWYRGEFTAGGFVVIISYIGILWRYVHDVGREVRNYLRAVAHAEELIALVHTPPAVADRAGAVPLHVRAGEVKLENVMFSYDDGKSVPIFRDFSLTIHPGEKVALVGHSGGGKSTFVKLLLRLYDLEGGRITIDGQDITEVTQESLRRAIALVPQDPILFHRSIRENIAYARPEATAAQIERAARLAHVHEFIRTLPKGYDTLVGERGVKLSGGERQRVAIARAILADTPILVLDEATSSLDSVSEKLIQEALATLMEGRTVIAIAHRLSTIKRVDRILVIEDGRIVEEGSHSTLVKKAGGLYRHFFELQAGGFIGE